MLLSRGDRQRSPRDRRGAGQFLGLPKQLTAAIKDLIGVIGRSRGKERLCYLRLSIGPVVRNDRGDKRSDLSPREDPALRILPCLDEYLFQALADEITA